MWGKNVVYFGHNIPQMVVIVPATQVCLIHLWKLITVYSFTSELKSYYTAKLQNVSYGKTIIAVAVLKSFMLYLSNTMGATIPLVGVSYLSP